MIVCSVPRDLAGRIYAPASQRLGSALLLGRIVSGGLLARRLDGAPGRAVEAVDRRRVRGNLSSFATTN